jgi:hypothetical protein
MKIIQFQAMPNDATWQGATLCLCDDGNLYIQDYGEGDTRLVLYASAKDAKTKNRASFKKDLINLIHHASYSIFESGADIPEGARKVIDFQDVLEIIEEEL